PELRLSVAGGSFYRAYERDAAAVRDLVRALGVSDHVRFLGEVAPNDVAALMRKSALLVVPSRRETFSLVTAEALASGTPVVAPRGGGPRGVPPCRGGAEAQPQRTASASCTSESPVWPDPSLRRTRLTIALGFAATSCS